jgi:hypothetical protein
MLPSLQYLWRTLQSITGNWSARYALSPPRYVSCKARQLLRPLGYSDRGHPCHTAYHQCITQSACALEGQIHAIPHAHEMVPLVALLTSVSLLCRSAVVRIWTLRTLSPITYASMKMRLRQTAETRKAASALDLRLLAH